MRISLASVRRVFAVGRTSACEQETNKRVRSVSQISTTIDPCIAMQHSRCADDCDVLPLVFNLVLDLSSRYRLNQTRVQSVWRASSPDLPGRRRIGSRQLDIQYALPVRA